MSDNETTKTIRERPRMTSVTGRTRHELLEERAAARAETPFTRGLAGNVRFGRRNVSADAAVQPSPSGLIGLAQAQDMVQSAVAGAVEGVHAFYRQMMGEEEFRVAYAKYHATGWDEPQPVTADEPYRPIEEEPYYMSAELDTGVAGGGGGEDRSGYISASGREGQEPQSSSAAEENMIELPDGTLTEQEHINGETQDNQPAGSLADAGTPEGDSGKEGPPYACDQCDFEAGSPRGLKAHKTTRHAK